MEFKIGDKVKHVDGFNRDAYVLEGPFTNWATGNPAYRLNAPQIDGFTRKEVGRTTVVIDADKLLLDTEAN